MKDYSIGDIIWVFSALYCKDLFIKIINFKPKNFILEKKVFVLSFIMLIQNA